MGKLQAAAITCHPLVSGIDHKGKLLSVYKFIILFTVQENQQYSVLCIALT